MRIANLLRYVRHALHSMTMRNNNEEKKMRAPTKTKNKLQARYRQQLRMEKKETTTTNEARTEKTNKSVEDREKTTTTFTFHLQRHCANSAFIRVDDSFYTSFVVQLRLVSRRSFHFSIRFPYDKSVLDLLILRWM